MNTHLRLVVAAAVLAAGSLAAPLGAQESRSAPLAVELSRELSARHVLHIAARDPDEDGRFVAAMYAAGPVLLVVSARYAVPEALDLALTQNQHAKAYADLNSASIVDSKLFIQDMGADGLLPQKQENGAFDLVYERVVKVTMYDGGWATQGMREDDYYSSYRAADARYARMLSLLLAELKKGS